MIHRIAIAVLLLALVGCKRAPAGGSSATPAGSGGTAPAAAAAAGPFGPPVMTPIMQPFQGPWRFSLAKTLAQWQADGVPAAEIAQAKSLPASFPLHPDLSITGDTAVLSPLPLPGEYKFFALHAHNAWVCGKAWHHEDRNDPGDMDKQLTRLRLDGPNLHLALRSHEAAADPNDPDVTTMPTLAGSAATCTADTVTDPPWSPWRTYVFERAAERP
jgi:hypothetical protein